MSPNLHKAVLCMRYSGAPIVFAGFARKKQFGFILSGMCSVPFFLVELWILNSTAIEAEVALFNS